MPFSAAPLSGENIYYVVLFGTAQKIIHHSVIKKELRLDLVASPRFSEKFTWNSNLKKLRLTSISRQFVTLSVGVSASLPTSNTNRSYLSSYNKTSMVLV